MDLSWLPVNLLLPPHVRLLASFIHDIGDSTIIDNLKRYDNCGWSLVSV